jgi:hypothetical protein
MFVGPFCAGTVSIYMSMWMMGFTYYHRSRLGQSMSTGVVFVGS